MGRTSDARQRLISAVLELIRERSYGAIGVEVICQRAGVNKGSFYHFFPSKSKLVTAALDNYWHDLYRRLCEPGFDKEIPPRDRIARFFTAFYQQVREERQRTGHVCGCIFGNLGGELSTQDESIRAKIDEIMAGLAALFQAALQEGAASGEIEQAEPASAAQALVACLEGLLLRAKISNDPEVFRRLSPRVLALVLADQDRLAMAPPQVPGEPAISRNEATTLDFLD